jgi:Transcriptional regulators
MKKISKSKEVQNYIVENIEKGVYRVGHMIDSELTLADKLGVSRLTVRDALRILVEENILEKQHGRGTFVLQQPQFKGFQCGIGFTAEMLRHNMVPSAKNVRVESVAADGRTAHDLSLPEDSEVWMVTRLRLADEKPIAVEQEFFSKAIVSTLTKEIAEDSIYGYLEKVGVTFSYVDQMIDAVRAEGEVAKQLEVVEGEPLVRMYLIAYLKNGTPFNCGFTYYRSDNFKLSQTVYPK